VTVEALNAALVAALGELDEPHKSGKAATGTYAYTYLRLEDLSRVVRAAFAKHGLAFTQHVTVHDQVVSVSTRLVHESGCTWRTEPLTLVARDRSPQAVGSAISYGRRYQLAALVGLSGSDDDDGAAASGVSQSAAGEVEGPPTAAPSPAASTRTPRRGGGPVTAAQLKMLGASFDRHGYGSAESRHAFASSVLGREVGSATELSKPEASRVIDALQGQPAERATGTAADDEWYVREPPEDPYAQ